MFGYMGKILRVDLSESSISEETLSEDMCKMFLGGSGMATKYLFDEVPKGADPLGTDNELIFMTGPLTGTIAPSSGRFSVVAKSPLTGLWGHANSGGFWGPKLKRSGFDGIIIRGISAKPKYLVVDNGSAELRDAEGIWGESVFETTKLLRQKFGKNSNVACIGIGGEKQVRYAAIMNENHRALGRCGMGAVMGSKFLKAIVVKGGQKIQTGNKDAFDKAAKEAYALVDESLLKITLEVYGTNMGLDLTNIRGGLPTRNWQTGVFPNTDAINGPAIIEKILTGRKACFACPIKCGRLSDVKEGPYACEGEGPEYESVGTLGTMCGIGNLEAITKAHILCNEYGLDTISAGSTIAFVMECYEKGIITKSETDGLDLKFGDADVMIELVHKIAKREGIGDLLAEGTKRISEKIGKGTEKFAMHVKGLELPAYDPRSAKICGLAYVTANRGGDHITAYVEGPAILDIPFMIIEKSTIEDPLIENPEEAEVVKDMEDAFAIFDAVGLCKFMGVALTAEEVTPMIANAIGRDFDVDEFKKTGERVYNIARAFNVREGLTKADDTLPKRLLEEPMPEGEAKGHVVEKLDQMLDAYYEFRGWDKGTGKPTPERLKELGLDDIIDKIY
ncbi:MAG: aldehyde ferredoxin oxidoreductase family protein [Desulfobacteraceae bacterium]|nr:aldehyde ferredoxin oxidoreductase family protein [Desulfobacteraceae bacterium]MBC2755400.1 aldehyde ferredoxin oxidoreductase family protein [Desulfobacteraceae bacterium]